MLRTLVEKDAKRLINQTINQSNKQTNKQINKQTNKQTINRWPRRSALPGRRLSHTETCEQLLRRRWKWHIRYRIWRRSWRQSRPRGWTPGRGGEIRRCWKENNVTVINQLINQSINQSINPSIHPSIDQSINQSINQTIKQSIHQSINQKGVNALADDSLTVVSPSQNDEV